VGFENELISQSTSPIGHRRNAPSRLANLFSPAGPPRRLGIRLGKAAASGPEYAANGPSYARRKAEHIRKRALARFAISRMPNAVKRTGSSDLPQAVFERPAGQRGKKSLTVFRCDLGFFTKNFRLGVDGRVFCIGDRNLGIRKRQPDDRQIDQAA
jgi:hypothetical protein